MSNPYGYNPKVSNPHLRNNIVQLRSGAEQTPFFFGGSQIPTDLFLGKFQYNGSKGSGLKNHKEMVKIGKLGKGISLSKNNHIQIPHTLPFVK